MAQKKNKKAQPAKATAKVDLSKKVTLYNVTISQQDTPVKLLLPDDTRALKFRLRTAAALKYAFSQAAVTGGSPEGPYSTLKSGAEFNQASLDLGGQSIWFAANPGGVVVEVECYRQK